jgi:hypothetical protein
MLWLVIDGRAEPQLVAVGIAVSKRLKGFEPSTFGFDSPGARFLLLQQEKTPPS